MWTNKIRAWTIVLWFRCSDINISVQTQWSRVWDGWTDVCPDLRLLRLNRSWKRRKLSGRQHQCHVKEGRSPQTNVTKQTMRRWKETEKQTERRRSHLPAAPACQSSLCQRRNTGNRFWSSWSSPRSVTTNSSYYDFIWRIQTANQMQFKRRRWRTSIVLQPENKTF